MKKFTKAVFFDRDGTLNVDTNFLHRVEEFVWIDGAKDAIKFCNDNGYLVIIITNQSGIARGYYSEDDVLKIHAYMNKELAKINAHIDDLYYCPHHIDGIVEKYKKMCNCRKPKSGMVDAAVKKYNIDRTKSFFVGDRDSDIECAKNANVVGLKYISGSLLDFLKKYIKF